MTEAVCSFFGGEGGGGGGYDKSLEDARNPKLP